MKKQIKIALCCAVCVLLTVFAACAAPNIETPGHSENDGIEMVDTAAETDGKDEQKPRYGSHASVCVDGTKAYVFDGKLYGAAAYSNNGDCPVTVTKADFHFSWNGGNYQETFEPACAQYDVLLPGETGYAICWIEGQQDLPADDVPTLSAEMICEKTQEEQLTFEVENARLIRNYPKFATLTGRVTNKSDSTCTLGMIVAGFYGADDEFLGAWYFTRQAKLEPGAATHFTSHLRALPLTFLADDCKRMDFHAFGLM